MTIDLRKSEWRELALIIAVSLPFIFLGIGSISLLDPDEGLYGSVALEMATSGDWITPHFNGLRYLEKPPLYFWLTALTIKLFGPSEWAVRLWSALPTLGTAIITWRLGKLFYGGQAGLLSAVIFLTGAGVFRYARVAATDSLLVFSLALSLYGFTKAALSQQSTVNSQQSTGVKEGTIDQLPLTIYSILFWLGMAIGLLSKGLIGLVFPLLIVTIWSTTNCQRSIVNSQWEEGRTIDQLPLTSYWRLRRTIDYLRLTIYSPVGLVLFLGLTVPWHLAASWQNPDFFGFYILDNQVLRFFSQRAYIEDDVPVSAIAFLVLTFLWFFPWSPFLWATLRHGFPDPRAGRGPSEQAPLLVGLWAVMVLGFFSLSSSTLEHYFLPAIPPLSLMVGAAWSEAFAKGSLSSNLKWSLVVATLGCVPVGFYLLSLSQRLAPQDVFTWLAEMNVYYRILREQGRDFPFSSVAPFVPLARGLGLVLVIGLPLSLVLFYLRRPRASFLAMAGVAAVVAGLVFRLVLIVEPHHSAREVALAVKAAAGPADLIVHEGPLEYSGSLPFYAGRQIHVLNGKRGDLEFGSGDPEGGKVFLDDAELAPLWEGEKRVFLISRLPGQESVRKQLSDKPVFSIGRYGSRFLYSNYGS